MTFRSLTRLTATTALTALLAGSAIAGTLFIPEGRGNSVLMVDPDTGAVIRRIEGLQAVHGLSGADGVPVLVAGSLLEIDPVEAAGASSPAADSADEHAAHHAGAGKPDGPAEAGVSLLSIMDAGTGVVLRRIELRGGVHHTAVSPGGAFAVATHPARDGISVVDLATFEVTGFVATGPTPNYAVFGDEPGTVFVSNAGNGTISEVDLNRRIVRRNLIAGTAPEHMAIAPQATVIYAVDADAGSVREVALDDGTVRRSFEIGGEIHGVALSDDGDRLFVTGKSEGKLAAVDLQTGAVTAMTLAPQPYHVTSMPGGKRLFVSSAEAPKVWIVDTAGMSVIGEIDVKGEGHQMVALP